VPVMVAAVMAVVAFSGSFSRNQGVPINEEVHEHQHRHLEASNNYDINTLIQNFQLARAKFMVKLGVDYGEYVQTVFKSIVDGKEVTVGRSLFDAPISWARMKRKVVMKILKAKIEGKNQPFVWSTGGHSSCAAHGNYANESYARVMNETATDIFAAVGMDFESRPYGMGSTSSGMEVASCMKEFFGKEPDVLSWDYGMTTGRDKNKFGMWVYRGSMLSTRPALVLFNGMNLGKEWESLGVPTFEVFGKNAKSLEQKFPDTDLLSEVEIAKMPEFVRAFRCGTMIERTNLCGDEKYTTDPDPLEPCNKRKYRLNWHPGWKWHALYGHFFSFLLIEIVDDALQMIKAEGSDPKALFDTLKAQEDADYQKLKDLPIDSWGYVDTILNATDIPNEVIYKKPNFCHTAKLPSQIRFKGILTEVEMKEDYKKYDNENFDKGFSVNEIKYTENDPEKPMPLAFAPEIYQGFCTKHTLQIDHPDFFVANSYPTKILLPNPSEVAEYGIQPKELQGYITMCTALCGWGCPKDTVSLKRMINGTGEFELSVNGVQVVNYTKFGEDCVFMRHSGGHKFAPNSDGKFEISAKTADPKMYARISAFVIW